MPETVGEYIDRLVTVEMRFGSGFPRGVIHRFYEAARAKYGRPLSYLAARGLADHVQAGDYVLVVAGAGAQPTLPSGETDGPLGAAAMARALGLGLGARIVLVTEEQHVEPIRGAFGAAGFTLMPDEWVERRRSFCAAWRAIPGEADEDRRIFQETMDTFHPSAAVFIEKLGVNDRGVFHTVNGTRCHPREVGNTHLLADLARSRGIFTVGIGDGGNEVGFGVIADAVREIQPYGKLCRCGCGGGMATVVPADVLVVAAISNWGAYGVEAALAAILRNPEVLHDEETERMMLHKCVEMGGFDGNYAAQVPFVDGTSAQVQVALVTMLRQIVTNHLRAFDRGF